jgi:hypothetical protein
MVRALAWVALLAGILAVPAPASAYAGPGSGLTVIGAALAFVGSIFLAIVGFIWYPVKRLVKKFKRRAPEA